MDPAPAGVFSGHSLVRLYIWVQRHAGRSGGPVFVGANPCIRPDTFQIEQFPQTTGKLFYCVNIGSSVTLGRQRLLCTELSKRSLFTTMVGLC